MIWACLLYTSKQRQTHYPLLIFVSEIELGQQFTENFKKYFPKETVGFVSSQTTDRLRMVEEFRNRALTILVSTTILERGVTFPLVDVFVLESNHKLFTKSALVQISGRVGRSKELSLIHIYTNYYGNGYNNWDGYNGYN